MHSFDQKGYLNTVITLEKILSQIKDPEKNNNNENQFLIIAHQLKLTITEQRIIILQ